jgi:CRP-like cAMP-binding protein
MKCPRARTRLTVSKAFRPPPVGPPSPPEVLSCLGVPPSKRSEKEIQIIFRYLLFRVKLCRLLENSDRVRVAACHSTLVTLQKGEVLFFEGDDPDGWFLVVSGSVDVIIRLFLVAEDCLIDSQEDESTEFAQLMDLMGLEVAIDKLKRVNRLVSDDIFGQHAYLLDRRRSATIVGSSDTTWLIRFEADLFQQTSTHILAKNLFNEHKDLIGKAFPRLREDQIILIASQAEVVEVGSGTVISSTKSLGRRLFIVKSGKLARYRVVDFTSLSFRTIAAPFERLELHFPDGLYPVHTDDLGVGTFFADPSLSELNENEFNVRTTTFVELVGLDLEYFRIVVGSSEIGRVRSELKSSLSERDIINIWVNSEKARLWKAFKHRELEAVHLEMRTDHEFKTSKLAIRYPCLPGSQGEYHTRKVIPYASKTLRESKIDRQRPIEPIDKSSHP